MPRIATEQQQAMECYLMVVRGLWSLTRVNSLLVKLLYIKYKREPPSLSEQSYAHWM